VIRVGIPKAFLYHKYFPMWDTFFRKLGVEVIVSPESNKVLVKQGIMNTIDEACLPLKTYMGHIIELANMNVDYIFIPRFISVEKHRYFCPKFLGLPDLIKNTSLKIKLPEILEPTINIRTNKKEFYIEVLKLASKFNKRPLNIYNAVNAAIKVQRQYEQCIHYGSTYKEALELYESTKCKFVENAQKILELKKQAKTDSENVNIAVIGHSYILYDQHISMNLISKLEEMNCNIQTAEMLSDNLIKIAAKRIPKDMFWTLNRELMGAAFHHLDHMDIDGIVMISAFACGPDAISKELIERIYKRDSRIPMLSLTIDEHTGEAGFVTRLEAFIDMIKRNRKGGRKHESNISAYGQLLGRDESVVSNARR